ncbi:MAG: preprotein translocase subunit SecE [Parachlamydiaceae bacterium]|nr:preprotein translocase subunit SecE [Parachlamydiaceae bacterium]
MEAKKAQTVATTKSEEAPVTTGKVVDFMGDVKAELKRISWTSPEELRVYTKIVVAMTFFMGMSIYFVDLLIQSFLTGLNYIFHLFA